MTETPAAASTAAKDAAPAVPETSDAAETSFYEDGFDPEAVWDRIVDIVARMRCQLPDYGGQHQPNESYRNGELSILVKANKIDLANDSKGGDSGGGPADFGRARGGDLAVRRRKGAPTGQRRCGT